MSLLETIGSPDDLKRIPREKLPDLAGEIRRRIIEVVAENGGHLAPNLGVVELAIALHRVYDSPRDKIIWDVSHQCYSHKLLTGREERFGTLRRRGGLSGFSNRDESPHDPFTLGHAGTSIANALGLALARDRRGEDYKVVAVIGDGSMTSGLAFEALNQAGDRKTDLTVILNDNTMSISPNVGAISGYLSRAITGKTYLRLKQEIQDLLGGLPKVGESLLKWARRLEESAKSLITPGMLFEEMGFKYVGPIDGHRLETLMDTLENVKKISQPVLVHVVTTKGKGYPPAEEDPTTFHGIGPFDLSTGTPIKSPSPPSYTSVFGKTMVALAGRYPDLVGITAAMPDGTGLCSLAETFPDRFFDVGIAEQCAVAMAAGLAAGGYHPMVAIYSTFIQRAYDQIVHDICLQDLPVTFCLDRGGLVGEDGPTHHGTLDLSFLRTIPNLVVAAPADEEELRRLLVTAATHPHPMAIRYPRGAGIGVPLSENPEALPIGKGDLIRKGRDVAIIAVGSTVHPAREAADLLAKDGIEAAVINARFIKPLDAALISSWSKKTGAVVTIEENSLMGGFGSAVAETLADRGMMPVRFLRIGIPDRFIEHGPPDTLKSLLGLDPQGIVNQIRKLLASGE